MVTPANRFQIPGGFTGMPNTPGGTYNPATGFHGQNDLHLMSGLSPDQTFAEIRQAQANAPIQPPFEIKQIPNFEIKDFKTPNSPPPSSSQQPIVPTGEFLGWSALVVAIIFGIAFLGGFIEAFQGSPRSV